MARLILAACAAFFLSIPASAAVSLGNLHGFCEDGNQQVTTQGQLSTTRVQRSYVSAGTGCTVTVYYTGTTTVVSLYSNATGTSKANPFVAASDGLWTFFAPTGTYDIKFSGGGIASPFTIAGYSVTATPVYVTAFGAACDGSTNDATALASAFSSGLSLAIPDGRTCVTGTGLTMSTNGQALTCSAGGGLQASSLNQILTITGTGNTIQGCTFDGNSAGSGGILVYPNGPTAFRFLNNSIKNITANQYPFRCDSCVDSLIQGNQLITGMLGAGLVVFASSQNVQVIGNTVIHTPTNSNSSAFDVQGGAGGIAVLKNIVLSGNSASETVGFCYEAGPFGGSSTSQITIDNNTCVISNTTGSAACTSGANQRACGGISVVGSTDSVISNNTINATNQLVDIAGIEVGNARIIVSNNSIAMGGGASGAAPGIQGYCAQCKIISNVINGFAYAAATATGGIIMYANNNQTNADDTLIGFNTIIFTDNPASSQDGIILPCNSANGTQHRNIIIGNNIVGPGTGNTNYGINLFATDATNCLNDGVIIANNSVYNINTALQLYFATNMTVINNRFTTVSTTYNCTSCTYANTIIPGNVSINKTGNPAVPLDVSGAANITGLLQASGGSYLTGGTSIGKSSAPVQTLDVNGTMNISSTLCASLANNSGGNCQDTANRDGPIIEVDGGDGSNFYRGRLQMGAGGFFNIRSPDGAPISFYQGASLELKCVWPSCQTGAIGVTFGSVPTCAAGTEGYEINVNDSTTSTWGASYTVGGGMNHVKVRCNGTAWTVMGK